MDVRVGLQWKLSNEELMLLNCGVGEDSWESLGLQRDPTSPLEISPGCLLEGLMLKLKLQYLASWCEELTIWKDPDAGKRLRAGWEGDNRGWDGWMASLTQWTWVWVSTGSWWWTRRPGVLQSMRVQIIRHDWATELNQVVQQKHTVVDVICKITRVKMLWWVALRVGHCCPSSFPALLPAPPMYPDLCHNATPSENTLFSYIHSWNLLPWWHLKVLLRGRSQDGGEIGRGDHFLLYKFIERTTERWANFTKQLLIA